MDKKELFSQELSIRDKLSVERSLLANRRTLLSYVRTSIGMLATGTGFLALLDHSFYFYLGWVMVVASPVIVIFGLIEHRREIKRFKEIVSSASKKEEE